MNKRQLIDDIRSFNPTAQAAFLDQFDEQALRQYLEHLKAAQGKRVHIHGWARKRGEMKLAS
jgi:hypothetical protein